MLFLREKICVVGWNLERLAIAFLVVRCYSSMPPVASMPWLGGFNLDG
jgi:hypothetical protein